MSLSLWVNQLVHQTESGIKVKSSQAQDPHFIVSLGLWLNMLVNHAQQ